MDSRTQERVEQWDSRPFSGGYDGLSDLADGGFSGGVAARGTWLFLLNGRVVGVVDGTIEDFEQASGTIYEAPDPALPLLCAMEEQGGETRAKYYTNETPLSEVDATLQDGSFTGYVELSENVLSGDYYAVYYGGRRMAAAYIGNAERLVTGEEAFERADDEVGIYEVVDVEVDVTDVPETGIDSEADVTDVPETGVDSEADVTDVPETGADGETDDDDAGAVTAASTGSSPTETDSKPSTADTGSVGSLEDEPADSSTPTAGVTIEDDGDDGGSEPTDTAVAHAGGETPADPTDDPAGEADGDTGTASASEPTMAPSQNRHGASGEPPIAPEDDGEDAPEAADSATTQAEAASDADADSDSSPDLAAVEAAAEQLEQSDISWTAEDADDANESDAADETSEVDTDDGGDGETEVRFEEEAQWRETRSIPSIDPDNSSTADGGAGESAARAGPTREADDPAARSDPVESATVDRAAATSNRSRSGASGDDGPAVTSDQSGRPPAAERTDAQSGGADERVAELTTRLERLENQRDELAARAQQLEAERDQLRSENEELSATVERLEGRIERLTEELATARSSAATGGEDATDGKTTVAAADALGGTNLFVRYDSKSQPTLETAHDGDADPEEVAANLRLEHHTSFNADDAVVDGESFETFLTGTMEYRFVDWLTEMVLYEIRDTGNANGLGDLYDAIPRIDRVEFDATISLADDDTADVPDQVSFDVVAFDKMGEPLVVADLNDSREPAAKWMLEEMEEHASAVKANFPSLAAATVVTSSYFEPGALEVTEQATSSGILSRGSKLSYVNLSRKQGYHLCLVESRDEGFHMNVPEL